MSNLFETDLKFNVPGESVRALLEKRAELYRTRALAYKSAAGRARQAEEAPVEPPEAEELVSVGLEAGIIEDAEGMATLARRQEPRATAAYYTDQMRKWLRKERVARLCAAGVQDRVYELTEEEVRGLHEE